MSFLSIGKTKFFDFKNFYAARVRELESYYLKLEALKGDVGWTLSSRLPLKVLMQMD